MPDAELARKKKVKVAFVSPPKLISLVNQSTRVSNADLSRAVGAIGRQLREHVAPEYGLVPAVALVPAGGTPDPTSCLFYLIDEPDVDGALGYHDEDARGRPYGKVFVNPILDNGGTVLTGPLSVSVTLSHEALELTGDAAANRWVDGPQGTDYAFELCDAVEGDAYPIDGVSVSNWLLQAFFDPKAPAGSRLDYLGKLARPFSMTPGGYQITRTEPGTVSQVLGAHHVEPLGQGLHLHFGADVDERTRRAKIIKALRRRARA